MGNITGNGVSYCCKYKLRSVTEQAKKNIKYSYWLYPFSRKLSNCLQRLRQCHIKDCRGTVQPSLTKQNSLLNRCTKLVKTLNTDADQRKLTSTCNTPDCSTDTVQILIFGAYCPYKMAIKEQITTPNVTRPSITKSYVCLHYRITQPRFQLHFHFRLQV